MKCVVPSFEQDLHRTRKLSKKENDEGWREFVLALERARDSAPVAAEAYEACSASVFTPYKGAATLSELLEVLTDDELARLDDLLVKSAGFVRPADRQATFTSIRFRVARQVESSALITEERMRRRIEALAPSDSAPTSTARRRVVRL